MTKNAPCCIAETSCPPPAHQAVAKHKNANDELAELTKAMGHPARVLIMRLLMERDSCVCGELVDELPFAQSTVSQHLKVLKEANLIYGEIDGPRICYCVNQAMVARFKQLVAAF